jgi:hypothetical protein
MIYTYFDEDFRSGIKFPGRKEITDIDSTSKIHALNVVESWYPVRTGHPEFVSEDEIRWNSQRLDSQVGEL